MGKSSDKRGNWRKRLSWLAAELFIIFIGVFLAFQLEQYRASRVVNERKMQIYSALAEEFTVASEAMPGAVSLLDSAVTTFIQDYEDGNMPIPERIHWVMGNKSDVWEASLQSGALELFDIHLLFELSHFFSYVRFVAEESKRLDRLVEQFIIPNADAGKEEFYNVETKNLRKKYMWYIDLFVNLNTYMQNVQKMTEDLKVKIDQYLQQ